MFAPFRNNPNEDLAKLGEEHMQKDLKEEDRELLKRASSKVRTHATVGSILGLGLGIALAYRIRSNRAAVYNALKVASRPTEVVFSNGARGKSLSSYCFHSFLPFLPLCLAAHVQLDNLLSSIYKRFGVYKNKMLIPKVSTPTGSQKRTRPRFRTLHPPDQMG